MDNLCKRLEKLVSVDPTELNLRAVRSLLKKHHNELGHIKTAGKGRNKTAIIKDLKQWLKNTKQMTYDVAASSASESDGVSGFKPLPNDSEIILGFNLLVGGSLIQLLAKKDKVFAERINVEQQKNDDFTSWEDVERRVTGFKRSMITDRNACFFEFSSMPRSLDVM